VRGGKPFLEQCDNCLVDGTVRHLLQTGPVLVWRNVPEPTLGGGLAHRRTFIAWDGGTGWILGQASRCGLKDLSSFLASKAFAGVFPLRDALNFDGGSSSGFWALNEKSPPFYLREHSIVRNFVGIRPKH
jgi:hypothetical protein